MRHDTLSAIIYGNCPAGSYPEQWNVQGLKDKLEEVFGITPPIDDWLEEDAVEQEIIEERIKAQTDEMMDTKIAKTDPAIWRMVEKQVLLEKLDFHWKEHLATLDALRQVIWMRGVAQKQPINEYKQEAFGLFETMLDTLREDVTKVLLKSELRIQQPEPEALPDLPDFLTSHIDPLTGLDNSNDGDGSELRRRYDRLPVSLDPARGQQRGGDQREPLCASEPQPQRAVPVRVWQEVQALPRCRRHSAGRSARLRASNGCR